MAPWLDSPARRLRGGGVVREEVVTEAETKIPKLASGGVSLLAVAGRRQN